MKIDDKKLKWFGKLEKLNLSPSTQFSANSLIGVVFYLYEKGFIKNPDNVLKVCIEDLIGYEKRSALKI